MGMLNQICQDLIQPIHYGAKGMNSEYVYDQSSPLPSEVPSFRWCAGTTLQG